MREAIGLIISHLRGNPGHPPETKNHGGGSGSSFNRDPDLAGTELETATNPGNPGESIQTENQCEVYLRKDPAT